MNKFEQFANEKTASDDDIASLSEMTAQLANMEFEITVIETKLAELKKKHATMEQITIPNKLLELGVSSIILSNGLKLNIKKQYFPNIKKDDIDVAYKWLREHGHGDIIKNIVSVAFPSGKDDSAIALKTELRFRNFQANQSQDIHPQTLKAWAKEQKEKGTELPDCIKVHEVMKAEIK